MSETTRNIGITEDAFITKMEVYLKTQYTEEQKSLIKEFGNGPVFCFADPGTGKTYTAIAGLLDAELFKGISGQNIYALSFTNMATGELAVRHTRACSSLGIRQTVNFQTLHKLCRQILSENYRKLGMMNFQTSGQLSMESAYKIVESSVNEWGETIEPNKIRNVVKACESLNAALVFDEDNVKTKMAFKQCNIDYKLFDRIRGLLFSYSYLSETITVSNLLLYTLMLLQKFPEVSEEFKSKCKLMLVDEAQDLSLLQLRVISMLTDNPVFIGDMKQQIYAFNGACQEIVDAFFRMYPDAKKMQLTRSFRCKNEIAEYATKIIKYNGIGGENFTGTGMGGAVNLYTGLDANGIDLAKICKDWKEDYDRNHKKFSKDILFLFRNNISAIPIAEELFKNDLPFRVNKYTPAFEVPVIKDLCELIRFCDQPNNLQNLTALRFLIPEFRQYFIPNRHPFYEICTKQGCSPFEVNYQFKDIATGSRAMTILMEVQEMLRNKRTMKDILNYMWPMYEEVWLRSNSWRLEASPKYYLASVQCLVHKDYVTFMQDEMKKMNVIKESEAYQRGIRCYTMHASKGLEADIVYIIDANEGLIPNASKLKDMDKNRCDMDAARMIREERSLCYVACTRAKEVLNIVSTDEPAAMLLGENPYSQYDSVYQYYRVTGDDIAAFENFVKEYVTQ